MLINNISSYYPGLGGVSHLAYYFPANKGEQDVVSKYLLEFKDGCNEAVSKWAQLSTEELRNPNAVTKPSISGSTYSREALKAIIRSALSPALPGISDIDLVVRALSSEEIWAIGDKPLDRFGEMLNNKVKPGLYIPRCLKKKRLMGSLKAMGAVDRKSALSDLYEFTLPSSLVSKPGLSILIIDDVITTGATLCEISHAIKVRIPLARISAFALARTHTRDVICQQHNDLVWKALQQLTGPACSCHRFTVYI